MGEAPDHPCRCSWGSAAAAAAVLALGLDAGGNSRAVKQGHVGSQNEKLQLPSWPFQLEERWGDSLSRDFWLE